jgi:hypothetical protein
MTAYLISFFVFDLSSSEKLSYIIFSPFVCVLSWIFFHFFLLVKDTRNLKYYLLGCTLIACTIIYTNGIFDIDIRLQNFFHSSKLPNEYSKYDDINKLKNQFGKHEIILFKASDRPVDQFLTKNNELIIHCLTDAPHTDSPSTIIHTFYKLDKDGDQIDEYSFKQDKDEDSEVLFEGYLINVSKHYFRSWPLNGDTTKKTIEVFNANLNWSADQQGQKLNDIESKAIYLLSEKIYHSDQSNSKSYTKRTYFIDDNWYVFYENISDDNNLVPQSSSKGRTVNDLFGHWDKNEWVTNTTPPNIRSVYYQKIKRVRNRHDVKTGKYEKGDLWQGCLFSQLIVENDTLRFKDSLYLDEKWHWSQVDINNKNIGTLTFENTDQFNAYGFYTNPALNYQLFTNQRNKLYLITKK